MTAALLIHESSQHAFKSGGFCQGFCPKLQVEDGDTFGHKTRAACHMSPSGPQTTGHPPNHRCCFGRLSRAQDCLSSLSSSDALATTVALVTYGVGGRRKVAGLGLSEQVEGLRASTEIHCQLQGAHSLLFPESVSALTGKASWASHIPATEV